MSGPQQDAGEDIAGPFHMRGMTSPHSPLDSARQDQVRAMLAAGDTVELAMDATAIIGGLLAELDRKDEVLMRQGRNIGQMAGDNDLLRARTTQTEPIIAAGLRWIAKPDTASQAALSEALRALASELMASIPEVADGSYN